MKVYAGLIVAASATVDRIVTTKGWPANYHAPHCGCQIIINPNQAQYGGASGYDGGHINGTCTLRFPYADQSRFGRTEEGDPHFVSVAGAYMVGRNRGDGADGFKFTGFDEVSSPDVLDILVFYERWDCARFPERKIEDLLELPQDERWEVYNLTESQTEGLCEFVLECEPNGGDPLNPVAHDGVHLGNFNYDIARSVQTYTVPIYGLPKGESATFAITDYYNNDNNCMNPLAHHGHGTAEGCSKANTTGECSNMLTFHHDQDHNGLLEYFQFEPVSLLNAPQCFEMPEHHEEDYKWYTPSPWDTQENFNPTQGSGPMPDF
jgi:hypothetical protein